ncbi:Haspin protein kinase protein [Lasiodiplodia theobromae]|uniref:Haspin protein kinase protein n=1 Tax=Lasiodiplodia theobromae TaxID=45133 RepID=UPI0015C2EC8A|nr:Haspin protein kinase protein [Lasiodiplodia theobromae]KAF4541528.1 Haspin protein kinase protein [Lasiodiplodia theobromae]
MARIKTTYGKRPKANTTFAASTDFWSSPDKAPSNANPAPADAVDEITNTLDNLDIREKEKQERKERRKKEKRDRALQAIDANAASPAGAREKATIKHTHDDGELQKPAKIDISEASVVPKTPQRLKKLLPPKKKLEEPKNAEQTPQSERRRRRGKRDIPTIILGSEDDDDAVMDQQQQKCRSRALSSPEPAHHLSAKTPARSTVHRRSKSPSIAATTRKPSSTLPDPLIAYTKPLLRLCADRAGRKAPTPFALWAAALSPYFSVVKIAEASYGEVYRLALKRAHPDLSASDESVLKIIALKPPVEARPKAAKGKKLTKAQKALSEKIDGMSSVESVAGEIKLLRRMAHVPGFTNFRDVRVLRGRPDEMFARAWAEWNEGREEEKRSIFPDPAKKGSYDEDQLWAVIEMQDAGTDLENLKMEDVGGVFGVWDIFWSVTLALGKGEEEARFEHRDLHMGNICIRPANANRPIAAPSSTSSTVTDIARNLNFTGLESTIIDYTLSRAQMTLPSASPDPEEAEIAFLDLEADPALFDGDAEEEYQYEMYRYMRAAMFLDDPLADVEERWDEALDSGRTWVGFHPQTNLVWLHFILHEMMKQIVAAAPSDKGKSTKNKKTKAKKKDGRPTRKKLVVVDSEDENEDFVVARRAQDAADEAERVALEQLVADKRKKLEKILRKVQKLLDPARWAKSELHSVKDLVALALEEAWLDEEDVIAVPQLGDEGEGSLLELVRGMEV